MNLFDRSRDMLVFISNVKAFYIFTCAFEPFPTPDLWSNIAYKLHILSPNP